MVDLKVTGLSEFLIQIEGWWLTRVHANAIKRKGTGLKYLG